MPKIYKTPAKAYEENVKKNIKDKILWLGFCAGINKGQLADSAGLTRTTFDRRMKDPGSLTVNELLRICAKVHKPITALLEE